jgi:hypothetical protein
MPCLLIVIALMLPRVTLFFIWLLTDWFPRAYETVLWPLLGFFFMPYTTLAYMGAMLNNNHQISGGWLIALIVAVVFDLSHHAETTRRGRKDGGW